MPQDQDANAGGSPAKDDSLSEADILALYPETAEDEIQPEDHEAESEVETEEEETEEQSEETETEEEAEDEETEEPSNELDLDSLSPEQLQELAGKARSKALARYGKLTARIKALESQLEQAAQRQPEPDPFKKETKVDNPRIAAIQSIEDLGQWRDEAESTEEWAQTLLDTYGHADAEDTIYQKGDKSFTKAQVLGIRNGARKALKNDIPARLNELQEIEGAKRLKEHNAAQVAIQVPEAEKDEEVKATYEGLKEHPLLKSVMSDPKAAAVAELLLAHAARSMVQTAKKPKAPAIPTGKTPRPKPPGTPSGGGAPPPAFKAAPKGKELAKQEADFDGDPEALVRLLHARQS